MRKSSLPAPQPLFNAPSFLLNGGRVQGIGRLVPEFSGYAFEQVDRAADDFVNDDRLSPAFELDLAVAAKDEVPPGGASARGGWPR